MKKIEHNNKEKCLLIWLNRAIWAVFDPLTYRRKKSNFSAILQFTYAISAGFWYFCPYV